MGARPIALAALLLAAGCGDDGGPAGRPEPDAGGTDAAVDIRPRCESDAQCDDGDFCNGLELCAPAADSADAFGCVPATEPACRQGLQCLEDIERCLTPCGEVRDGDGDGHDALACGGDDCDDNDANRFPTNAEVCDPDGHDEDCDPTTFGLRDTDMDGAPDGLCCNTDDAGELHCGPDCDDFARAINPMATEGCDDVDNDCDGEIDEYVRASGYYDGDLDLRGDPSVPITACPGAPRFSLEGDDCDDVNPLRNGAQVELCDERDNDCDAEIDEDPQVVTWYEDADGDGFGDPDGTTQEACTPPPGFSLFATDCDDGRADRSPAAAELCDGADNDCDGRVDEAVLGDGFADADGDGWGDDTRPRRACPGLPNFSLRGGDCDDARRSRHPGRAEECDDLDNDCDSVIDEGVRIEGFLDRDRDLHGDPESPATRCVGSPGFTLTSDDCDDTRADRNPSQAEFCDEVDNDCDDTVDEGKAAVTWYRDADADGYGVAADTLASCTRPSGYALLPFDCDDHAAGINPAAAEQCNGRDDDCDGRANYLIAPGNFEDDDADGAPDRACGSAGSDCDDQAATRHPGAAELCDLLDNDCDGSVDEESALQSWYPDLDLDGHGDASASPVSSCAPVLGHAARAGDCDDSDPRRHPGVPDDCDGVDADCDGRLDETAPHFARYRDHDGDGHAGGEATLTCRELVDHYDSPGDCNDGAPGIHPGASERCDGVDDDCDGAVDEGQMVAGYRDRDGDLHGDPGSPLSACPGSSDFSLLDDDCNDVIASIHGAALELCDGIDNDCDDAVDEERQAATWYPDLDGDGYGDPLGTTAMSCSALPGYSLLPTDCADSSGAIRPGARERCDRIDNDCDGRADEGLIDAVAEACDGVRDDDCDGAVDEGCVCTVGLARSCGITDVGVCSTGIQTCVGSGWGRCVGAVNPVPESCDERDNDCDGASDEDLPACGLECSADVACSDAAETCVRGDCTFLSWLTGSREPSPRSLMAAAYDGDRDVLVVFGGFDGERPLADTWEWDGTRWREVTPAVSPSARSNAQMIYDPVRQRVVLFGGATDASTPLDDTWVYDGSTWTEVSDPASAPATRRDAVFVFDAARGVGLLFGGYVAEGPANTLNDTWLWDGSDWMQQTPAASPPARSRAMAGYDAARGRVVVFGGQDATLGDMRDTWEWNGSDWAEVCTASPCADARPSARVSGVLTFDAARGNAVLFGGLSGAAGGGQPGTYLDDAWTWDGSAWVDVTPASGPGPTPRVSSSLVYDATRSRGLLFGGYEGVLRRQDLWSWDGGAWSLVSEEPSPAPRQAHAMAYDERRGAVVLFGGFDGTTVRLADTWERDGIGWTRRSVASGPSGRVCSGQMVYDSARGVTLLFGGSDGTDFLQDTWLWNGAAWTEVSTTPTPPPRASGTLAYDALRGQVVLFGGLGPNNVRRGDTWLWNGAAWSQASPTGATPPARQDAMMVYDSERAVTVLFGGTAGAGRLRDTWEWDGTRWTQRTTAAGPSPRASGAMVYDPVRRVTFLFGGFDDANAELGDLWMWDGTSWTRLDVSPAPPARGVGAIIHDSTLGVSVLFGGRDGVGRLADTWLF